MLKSLTVPLPKGFTPSTAEWSPPGTEGTLAGHAACEIYFPSIGGWVRCDPAQRTVDFGKPHFIKLGHAADITNIVRTSISSATIDALDLSNYEWPKTSSS